MRKRRVCCETVISGPPFIFSLARFQKWGETSRPALLEISLRKPPVRLSDVHDTDQSWRCTALLWRVQYRVQVHVLAMLKHAGPRHLLGLCRVSMISGLVSCLGSLPRKRDSLRSHSELHCCPDPQTLRTHSYSSEEPEDQAALFIGFLPGYHLCD